MPAIAKKLSLCNLPNLHSNCVMQCFRLNVQQPNLGYSRMSLQDAPIYTWQNSTLAIIGEIY